MSRIVSDNLTPKQAEREDKIFKAWILKTQGRTLKEIGMALQCAESTAWNYVKTASDRGLERLVDRVTTDKLAMVDLLDNLVAQCFDAMKDAVDVMDDNGRLYRDGIKTRSYLRQEILKHLDMKAKILGFYATDKIEQIIEEKRAAQELQDSVDANSMDKETLDAYFADLMRNK